MKPPCVTVVKYLLPAVRVLVTKELIERYNLRRIEASERMELTPAAITQYFKGERGATLADEVAQSKNAMEMIAKLAEVLAKKEVDSEEVIEKLCRICTIIRNEGTLCKLHRRDLPKLTGDCRCISYASTLE
ncbi:MAG: transcriptional regulator [Candidatus Bathyarchaeia archaeon]